MGTAYIRLGRFLSPSLSFETMRKCSFVILLFFLGLQVQAQTENPMAPEFAELDYSNPSKYTIAQINVIGAEARDDNAIKSITGLREGKTITLPSNALSAGIKKLWDLGLFADVSLVLDSIVAEEVYLTIKLQEQPILSKIIFQDHNKTKTDKLIEELGGRPRIGGIVTANDKISAIDKVKDYYIEKGFLDVNVNVRERKDTSKANSVALIFNVEKEDRVKIKSIDFVGNTAFADKKLRKQLKNTKQKSVFLKKSKYVVADYKEDKKTLIQHYIKNGYSDAEVVGDSIWRDDKGFINMQITVNEGFQYKYGDITWKGNTIYTDDQLASVLGIKSGDVVNPEELSERLEFSLDGRDVSSL